MTHRPGTPQPHKHSWVHTHTHLHSLLVTHTQTGFDSHTWFQTKSSLALAFLWPVFCLTEGIEYDHTSLNMPRWHTLCVLKNRWVCPRRLVCEHSAWFCSTQYNWVGIYFRRSFHNPHAAGFALDIGRILKQCFGKRILCMFFFVCFCGRETLQKKSDLYVSFSAIAVN